MYAAGLWRLGVRNGVLRYWPSSFDAGKLELAERVLLKPVLTEDTAWLEERSYRVVADFPTGFYRERVACKPGAAGGPDTEVVWLWLVREE